MIIVFSYHIFIFFVCVERIILSPLFIITVWFSRYLGYIHIFSWPTVPRKSIRPFVHLCSKLANFKRSGNYLKMQNSHFFDKFLLELLANLSEKDFVQKFSFAWILQVVKVRCFQFYLIKCPFFQISNFETL